MKAGAKQHHMVTQQKTKVLLKAGPAASLLLLAGLLLASSFCNAQFVYKTPSGNRYHLASCRSVRNVSEKVSLARAQQEGLTACLICKPAALSGMQTVKPAAGENKSTVQCMGLTKAGNRCLHKTNIGNGFCYQHQPG